MKMKAAHDTMTRVSSPTAGRFVAAIALIACLAIAMPSAHKTVLSAYTYHRDVAPILQARCASCHADGGVAFPMATYAQAKAAAWPIQQAVVSGRMPIWYAEPQAVPFKGAHALSANELNILMTWGAGGQPEGARVPAHGTRAAVSTLGAPKAILEMPEPFTLTADQREADRDIVWPAGDLEGTWIEAADVLPGAGSIVRRASVAIRSADGEQIVSDWIPGDAPQALPGGAAFKVPDGSSIVVRIHYQQVADRARAVADRSRVALYGLAPAAAHAVSEITVAGGGDWPFERTQVFTQDVDAPVRIVAVRPISGPTDGRVALTIVHPDGRRVPLARLGLRPEWPRRYIFATPVAVAAGSRIEAAVTPSFGVALASLTGDRGVGHASGGSLRVVLETIR
jgi:hypothetical protein